MLNISGVNSLLLFICLFYQVHLSIQQTTITIGQTQNYVMSSKTFRYGYFYMSYEKLGGANVGLRLSKTTSTTSLDLVTLPTTGDGFNDNFDDKPTLIASNFKLMQYSNPVDYYFVLYNMAIGDSNVTIYSKVVEIFRPYLLSTGFSTYLQKGEIEKITCSTAVSPCIDITNNKFYLTINPIEMSAAQYKNNYPINMEVYVQYSATIVNSNGELILGSTMTPLSTFSISSYIDFKAITVSVPSSVIQSIPVKDVKPYIWIKCLDSNYGPCSFSYTITNSADSLTSNNDATPIVIGVVVGVVGALILLFALIFIIVVAYCVYRARKAKRRNKEPQVESPNNVHLVDTIQSIDTVNQNRPIINIDSIPSHKSSDNGTPISTFKSNNGIDSYNQLTNNSDSKNSSSGMGSLTFTNSYNQSLDSTQKPSQPNDQSDLLNMRYKPIEKIGNGSFGVCFLCQDTRKNNQLVAIKGINLENNDQEKIVSELSKSATIQHPRVVEVHEFFISKKLNAFCLVMKYYSGDLEKCVLKYGKPMPEVVVIQLMKQLGEGFDYLHRVKQIVHRDVKPRNIFVDNFDELNNQISVVVGDLGESKELFGQENTMRGTILYMAPEVFIGKYGFPADIFSLGVSLYHVMIGLKTINTIIAQELAGDEQKVLSRLREDMLKQSYSEKLVDFVISMMRKDPSDRPTAEQVKSFSNLDLA